MFRYIVHFNVLDIIRLKKPNTLSRYKTIILRGYIIIVKIIKGIPLNNGIFKKLLIKKLNPIKIIHSFLIAIIGSSLDALNAGYIPKNIPIPPEKKKATKTEDNDTIAGQPIIVDAILLIMKPNKTPTIPPIKDNSADSHKN